MTITLPRSRATVILTAGFVLFAAIMVYLIAASLRERSAAEYQPTEPGRAHDAQAHKTAAQITGTPGTPRTPGTIDTLTIDARGERAWRFVSLRDVAVLAASDTVGWDLAVRRHHIIASGAIADLGVVTFDATTKATDTGYVASAIGRDSSNAAAHHWYRYGMLSHLLEPNGHVFAVRTTSGHHFKFEVLSYYCRGLEGGCLTIRFAPLAAP